MTDVKKWKEGKMKLPTKPSIQSWDAVHASPTMSMKNGDVRENEQMSQNVIRLHECYLPMDEQQAVVDKIKQLIPTPYSAVQPLQFPPSLNGVVSRDAFDKAQQLLKENRVLNQTMQRVIGVFFKTQDEVDRFASLLTAEGIAHQTKEKQASVFEGVNVLRAIYDPDSSQCNFVELLQLPSLHLTTGTINRLIRNAHNNKRGLFAQVKEEALHDDISREERQSLQLLVRTISSLHDSLLLYPGSYLLYQFYTNLHELPFLLADASRQNALLLLLNELLYIEDGRSPLLAAPKASFNKLHDYIEYLLSPSFTRSLLQYLPLYPFTSLADRLKAIQGHPLLKVLRATDVETPAAEPVVEEGDKNMVIVGTYNDIGPNYYTVLLLSSLHP